jgi:opacity protein-like surface antigen
LAVVRMFLFADRLALAIVLATHCLGARTAHAQAAPVPYWSSGWPIGFGGTLSAEQDSPTRYNFQNGMFVGSTSSAAGFGTGLGWTGLNQTGAFGSSLRYEGVQTGYNFASTGGLPVTIYAGFDTLKYNTGIGSPFSPFDSKSGTLPGYRANVGIEFKPTSNLSLSLGVGYVQQQSGNIDSEINSLPGASSIIPSGRR